MIAQVLAVVNPFDSSNADNNTIGFVALCAGAMVIFDFVALMVVVSIRRRRRLQERVRRYYYR